MDRQTCVRRRSETCLGHRTERHATLRHLHLENILSDCPTFIRAAGPSLARYKPGSPSQMSLVSLRAIASAARRMLEWTMLATFSRMMMHLTFQIRASKTLAVLRNRTAFPLEMLLCYFIEFSSANLEHSTI